MRGLKYMESNIIKLEGTVDDVVYRNPDNGYIVLDLATEDDLVTVVGELGQAVDGEMLVVYGQYVNSAKFGRQFRATHCERELPTTYKSIEKYLSSGIIKGIGESTAKRIVSKFKGNVFDVVENHPERLAQVKGISKNKAIEISTSFKTIFYGQKVYEFLQPFGVSTVVSAKASKKWKLNTLSVVQSNPYALCCDGINLPFETAERIAASLKFKRDCYERVSAGFFDVLSTALSNGHTCLSLNEFWKLSQRKLGIGIKSLETALERATAEDSIVVWKLTDNHEQYVYLKPYYDAEKYIAKKVYSMANYNSNQPNNHTSIIEALERSTGIFYNEQQQQAINMAIDSNFMVLTGGPGTGKTTTLNGIITMLASQGLKVRVTAPTGRATQRVTEVTGYDAMTIHRLLEVVFDEDGNQSFRHNQNNPIQCDAVVVDEMSMVDTLLFASLLRAVSKRCKLILVGDSDQLPSVSAGNVLKDLISSKSVGVVVLDEVFRQAQESAIIMNAHNVIKGEYPNIYLKNNDFFFLQRLNCKSAQDTIVELWKDRLPKTYEYSPLEDIQVLCPSKKGSLGTITLNQLMQEALNPKLPKAREVSNGVYSFRIGDKVMQTKNNYDVTWKKGATEGTGIYNGDIGYITMIDNLNITIDFDGRIVVYEKNLVDQLDLAYAITIHKSQGSEFNAVIMPMLNNFKMLSYRNLLYTGITRAKKLLVVVGSKNELFAMVDNDRKLLRYSNLNYMLQKEFSDGSKD